MVGFVIEPVWDKRRHPWSHSEAHFLRGNSIKETQMTMLTIYTDAAITTFVPFRFSSFLDVVDRFRWCHLAEGTERVAKQ